MEADIISLKNPFILPQILYDVEIAISNIIIKNFYLIHILVCKCSIVWVQTLELISLFTLNVKKFSNSNRICLFLAE